MNPNPETHTCHMVFWQKKLYDVEMTKLSLTTSLHLLTN